MSMAASTRLVGAPRRGGRVLVYAALTILAVLWLVPFAWAVATSLKPDAETTIAPVSWRATTETFAAYKTLLQKGDILHWWFNSFVTASLITAGTVLTASLAAFAFSRVRFRGSAALQWLVLAGLLIPFQALIVPLFAELKSFGLADTYWGIVLPQVVAPVMVFVLKKFFDGISRDYEDAARVDGASRWRIVWSVMVPMSRPILVAVGIFTFIGAWNNFLWPFIVTTDPSMMTIPVGLANVQGSYGLRYAQIMASAVLGGLPLLIVYALFQRHVVRGVGDAGIKG